MAAVVTCAHCGKRNRLQPRDDGVPRCANCHNLLPWLVDADQGSFDAELKASVPVVVDFWAPWCGPCRWIGPLVEQAARNHAGKLKVIRLNVDQAPLVGDRYEVLGIPTLMVLR